MAVLTAFRLTRMLSYLPFVRAQFPFLLFGFLILGLSNFGQTFFIGLHNAHIRATFGLSSAEFGGIYSAVTLVSAGLLLYSGALIDRIRLRVYVGLVLGGLGISCIGIGLSGVVAQSPSGIALLALALLSVRHCGQGLCGHIGSTAMSRTYSANRGRSVAIANLGYASGEAVMPLAAIALLAAISWQSSWLIYGCAILLLLPLLTVLAGKEPAPETVAAGTAGTPITHADRSTVLRDRRFYLLLPLYTAPAFLLTGMFFHQTALAAEKGWQLSQLALAFGFYALVKVISMLTTGALVDRYTALQLLPFSALPLLLAFVSLLLPAGLMGGAAPFIYLGLCGANIGAVGPISGGLWAELFGTRHLGAIRSMISPIAIFTTALAPVLFGLLLDAQVSFACIATGCVLYTLVAAGLSLLPALASGRRL